jgi:mono/diheme cytochrome c family protein
MKNKTSAFLIIGFLAFLGTAMYVYAQSGYEPAMMRDMMNGNYNNKNYFAKNYTSAKLSEDTKKGEALFESLCAQCHGQYAQGKIGPNIQGASISNINWALSNVSMMGSVSTNPQLKDQKNIYYISRFLESIKKGNNN